MSDPGWLKLILICLGLVWLSMVFGGLSALVVSLL
jgi:hypothetical protein